MPLAPLLLLHSGAARERLAGARDLEAMLAALVAGGRQAWPQVALTDERFLAHVGERLAPTDDPVETLRALHAGDLYLACACGAGNVAALAEFDRQYIARIIPPPSRDPINVEELRQSVRMRLLVGAEGQRPRIVGYSGGAPLANWLRVAVARVVVDIRRTVRPESPLDQGRELRAPAPDPELAYLKARYGREFEEAFDATVATLESREVSILQLFFMEDMTSKAIGQSYGVSDRTVQRWLAAIREKMMEDVHRRLAMRLKVSDTEMGSILNLVRSQVAIRLPEKFRK